MHIRNGILDWHAEDLKALIRKRGSNLSAIARRSGLKPQSIAHALFRPDARAEQAISEFLKIPAHSIWPSRYNADGSRKRPQPRLNYRRGACFQNVGGAA
ncbi:helix-turn-helix domain-containing protein [Blastomonas sp. CCH1-A6]|uniref:helix-turn-helix domain-containing protein n=1 Tax=Blastomonas sp. CCH1-A6 TaxID=1768762 RepID=UPI0009EB2107